MFIDRSKELRDRWKQLKALASFVNELGKSHAAFSKDLGKLSAAARSNVNKSQEVEEGSNSFINEWWRALSSTCEHLSSDREAMSKFFINDAGSLLTRLSDEQAVIEKRLTAEGAKLITRLADSLSEQESCVRDRDKFREKVLASVDKGVGLVIGGHDSKAVAKLQIREIALLEQTDKTEECMKEFMTHMPKVVQDCSEASIRCVVDGQVSLDRSDLLHLNITLKKLSGLYLFTF
jgi:hypothetical protein